MELSTALKISGGAHGALVLLALVGGIFSGDFDEAMQVTEVSVISGAEFAALVEQSGSGTPSQGAEAESQAEPDPEPRPEPEPEPESEPEPTPEPEPEPDPTPPEAATPPAVPENAGEVLAPEPGDTPEPAPRVAPRPADRPERDVAVAPEMQEAAEPVPADETPPEPAERQEAEAPEAASTRIVTEATEEGGAEQIALAPAAAPRPRTRPDRPAPSPEPEQVARPEPEPEPDPESDPLADAIAGAVADAVAGGGAAQGDPGPPMTAGERDALRLAVQECWVVDVGSEAANVTVTVGMRMSPDGMVIDGTLQMLEASGGSDAAIQSAFQSARRAILRCQRGGYDLPPEKYAQWEAIEMVFNPEEMRLR